MLSTVHEMVETDCNIFVYEIRSLLNTSRNIVKFKIKNDRDVQFAIEKANGVPKVYMIIKP